MTTTPNAYYLNPQTLASLMAEAQRRRADLETKRLLRATAQRLDVDLAERRAAGVEDRRSGSDRRFHTMADKLAAEAQRQGDRRFSVVPHSALMGLDS